MFAEPQILQFFQFSVSVAIFPNLKGTGPCYQYLENPCFGGHKQNSNLELTALQK